MFDALDRVHFHLVLPQVPQRAPTEHVDPAVPLFGMVTGMALGYATRHALGPKGLALAGGAVWISSLAASKLSFAEPRDYFGRDNAPDSLAYGLLAIVSAFGSSWAMSGAWHWLKGR